MPSLTDTDDETVRLLRVIAQNVSPGRGDVSINQGDTILEQGTIGHATYVTSGKNGMSVEEEWSDVPLPFPARVCNVRFGHTIYLAFDNPHDNPAHVIPLDPALDTSPFTIGDSRGFGATSIWVKAQPSVDVETEAPVIDFIAYQ